jgi:ribosomal protein S4
MLKAGTSEDRARAFIAAGHVRSGGQVVTDPDMPDDSEPGPSITAI